MSINTTIEITEEELLQQSDKILTTLDAGMQLAQRIRDVMGKAIQKQIPSCVIYRGDGYSEGELVYDEAECPDCGHMFEEDDQEWNSNYCPYCGKKLNWEGGIKDVDTGSIRETDENI